MKHQAIHQWTDNELLQGYVEGDECCFEALMQRYKSKLYTLIFLIVKDRNMAEDIFQDTMFKIVRMLQAGKYTEEGKFLPWASRIARNLAIDHFRKKQKFQVQRDTEENSLIANLDSSDINADNSMIIQEEARYVRSLIQQLPDKQREVLIMRAYADMSFKEIAERTQVSINTALGRMRYALINLKKLADENGFSQPQNLP